MIRLADYIMRELADTYNVRDIFMISGGGSMHLVDALGRNSKINYIANHHEQACAIAAEAYSRINGKLGVCMVTTGPGATNTITGLLGAWLDSIPTLFISGQVKRDTLATPGMRQLGDQEANVIEMVKSITKYAVLIDNPESIRYHLEKAILIATSGRPGPVWIDIPLDIQSAKIEEANLQSLTDEEKSKLLPKYNKESLKLQVAALIEKLKTANRPVLFAGNGIRLAGGVSKLQNVIKRLNIPVLTSFNAMDLVGQENPFFYGRPGTIGGRAANFVMQNSDLLLSVGSRLNIRIISYNQESLARNAYKVVVDIDPSELNKKTINNFDLKIEADALDFLDELDRQIGSNVLEPKMEWLDYCTKIKKKYHVLTDEHKNMKDFASTYYFIYTLSDLLNAEAVMTMGNGMACVVPYKVFQVKFGQRLILNSGCAAMGYGLPAAIGACIANRRKQTICVTGDGSIMMNLQELQTIVHNNLPIKIFILDNNGYTSIRTTQSTYFGGFFVGSDSSSGVSCPDFSKIARAFGMEAAEISTNADVEEVVKRVLSNDKPTICRVKLDPEELMLPKLSSEVKADGTMVSKPLEDMFPFLPRDEFRENMLIPTYNE